MIKKIKIKMKKKNLIIFSLLFLLVCGSGLGLAVFVQNNSTTSNSIVSKTSSSSAATTKTVNSDDLDWTGLSTKTVVLSNTILYIDAAGIYQISGTSTASIVVNCDGNVKLILNNVTINSSDGPAIYIKSAKNTVIEMADGTINAISDSSTRSDSNIDGAIYSADDLFIAGSGSLSVAANHSDAIVSKDDLTVNSGTITINSKDDAIKGRDSVKITGGVIKIDAEGDAIKATNDADVNKGYVVVSGGEITIAAGDDGIHAEESVVIDGGKISIADSQEGIEGLKVTINNGEINIYASDDGINAPGSNFTSAVITINGGSVTVKVGQGDTDAIDANGSVYINGGTVNLTANISSVDYDNEAKLNGGTLIVNGSTLDSIPVSMTGGGGGMRR